MNKIFKKVGQIMLVIAIAVVLIAFTYTAYDVLDYLNIGADNS